MYCMFVQTHLTECTHDYSDWLAYSAQLTKYRTELNVNVLTFVQTDTPCNKSRFNETQRPKKKKYIIGNTWKKTRQPLHCTTAV